MDQLDMSLSQISFTILKERLTMYDPWDDVEYPDYYSPKRRNLSFHAMNSLDPDPIIEREEEDD